MYLFAKLRCDMSLSPFILRNCYHAGIRPPGGRQLFVNTEGLGRGSQAAGGPRLTCRLNSRPGGRTRQLYVCGTKSSSAGMTLIAGINVWRSRLSRKQTLQEPLSPSTWRRTRCSLLPVSEWLLAGEVARVV